MSDEMKMIMDKLENIYENVQGLNENVDVLKTDVQGLKEDVGVLKTDVQGLKSDMSDVKGRLGRVETEVVGLRCVVENEVSRMINIVADGHLDLRRELKKAQGLQDEKERMELQILKLNIDMKEMKRAIGIA